MDNNSSETNAQNIYEIKSEARSEDRKIPLHEAVLAWCVFALSFVFTHFCVRYFGGLWGGIFQSAFGVMTVIFARFKRIGFTAFQWVMWGIAEAFCLVPIFSASGFICFLAAAFSFAMYLYLMLVTAGAEPFGKRFVSDLMRAIFERPFERFTSQPIAAFSVFKGTKRVRNILCAVIGLVAAIPLTIVVAMLLASSDAGFRDLAENIIGALPRFSFAYVWEIIFAAPIAMYLFGALCSTQKPVVANSDKLPTYRVLPPVIAYFAVSPICVFYLVYMVMQIGNIARIAEKTMSYSQFARRGFFELCAIAVINLFVIMIMQMFVKRGEGDKRPIALRVYTLLISAFTLGIIATALTKMFLYVGEYGMTLLRVYTSWFMVLLAVVFVTIMVLQLREIPLWKALFFEFTTMLAVLCFGNFEGNIARYNIAAYRSGNIEELDISEFYELGYAAAVPASELTDVELDPGGRVELAQWFSALKERDSEEDKFGYFSVPRIAAMKAVGSMELRTDALTFVVNIDESAENMIRSVTAHILFNDAALSSESCGPADGTTFTANDKLSFEFAPNELSEGVLFSSGDLTVEFEVRVMHRRDPIKFRFTPDYPQNAEFTVTFDKTEVLIKQL